MPDLRETLRTAAIAVALALTAGETAPAQTTRADGWALLCEAGACRASLASASGLQALMIGRFPGADGVSVGIASQAAIPDRERPINLRLDGRAIATLAPERGYQPFERPEAFWVLDARAATAIVQAGGAGRTLRIEYLDVSGAPHDADFDLSGLDALLTAMDDRLGRKAKREGLPPRGIAAAPAASKAELIVRQGPPARLLERHMAASDCEDPGSPRLKPVPPVIGPLSRTAMLYAIPCAASGGQVSYRLWVVESGEIGGITPLYFASFDEGFGWRGTALLPNVGFDAKEARLVARSATRADSGCGTYGAWRWKDYDFAMEEFRASSDCAGSRNPADWRRVFPAR